MLQLDRRGLALDLDSAERAALRAHFDEHLWARLPGILQPSLLSEVQRRLGRAHFVEHAHEGVHPPSVDLVLPAGDVQGLLEMAVNDPTLYAAIEDITGCDRIGHFTGFVYRMVPARGRHNWHNDLILGRMIAMSVNIGPGTYRGGILELRRRATGDVIAAVENTGSGDGVIFALDPSLEHRVGPVIEGIKTAFVGWFCRGVNFIELLRTAGSGTSNL